MFSNRARIFVGGLFIILLAFFITQHVYPLAAFSGMVIILLVVEYFRQGTLILAAKAYHEKDFDKTAELLAEIKKPEWLTKRRRGYYEYLMGGICLQKQDYNSAESHYELAAQYPLRHLSDHIAALVHVANICIRQSKYDKAEAYVQLALKHEGKISAKMKAVIERLQQEIKKH
jgi:hypothetical protein